MIKMRQFLLCKVKISQLLTQEKDDFAKFVLSYRAKTRDEMVTSKLLSNINTTTCKEVADIGLNLTHFVVGVSYGGSCDITFKQVLGLINLALDLLLFPESSRH